MVAQVFIIPALARQRAGRFLNLRSAWFIERVLEQLGLQRKTRLKKTRKNKNKNKKTITTYIEGNFKIKCVCMVYTGGQWNKGWNPVTFLPQK